MKRTGLVIALFSLSIAASGLAQADNGTPSAPQNSQGKRPPNTAPLKPYPRLLPLELTAPPTGQAGIPIVGISVSLNNPGSSAPNARLRLSIHETKHGQAGDHRELTPNNVKLEVLENGAWIPVLLGMADESVMGAIGPQGVAAHRERYNRGGFEIPAGFNKNWQLRVTFSVPGTYSLVASVSPDNGSRHLAQPAHTIITVQ